VYSRGAAAPPPLPPLRKRILKSCSSMSIISAPSANSFLKAFSLSFSAASSFSIAAVAGATVSCVGGGA
jgi:hypothetical protein